MKNDCDISLPITRLLCGNFGHADDKWVHPMVIPLDSCHSSSRPFLSVFPEERADNVVDTGAPPWPWWSWRWLTRSERGDGPHVMGEDAIFSLYPSVCLPYWASFFCFTRQARPQISWPPYLGHWTQSVSHLDVIVKLAKVDVANHIGGVHVREDVSNE